MGARENDSQISQIKWHLKYEVFRILPVFSQFLIVKFDIHFLGLPWEVFFGVITDV